jgi:prepilin-type N-terminal cleavage/methylation domain-containing protein
MLKFHKKSILSLNHPLNSKKGFAQTCFRGGFTLIELMVVIAVIGLLSAIVFSSLNTARTKGTDASNKMALQQVKNALALYASDNNGSYPLVTSSLVAGKYISAINPNIFYSPINSTGGVCTALPCSDFSLSINDGSGSFCGDSPVPGTVCPDGTVYVSSTLRTTPSDAGGYKWGPAPEITSATDMADGRNNVTRLKALNPNLSVYPAVQACENLTANGKDDWYLPAKSELDTLYNNRVAIGNFNISGLWPSSYYWSSTEYNSDWAYYRMFSQLDSKMLKNYTGVSVRCVRRP